MHFARNDRQPSSVKPAGHRIAGCSRVLKCAGWARYIIIPVSLLPFLVSPAAAETLSEAMAAALQRHPSLQAEEARNRAARAGINVARAGYYPRVTASGDIGVASGSNGLGAGTDSGSSRIGSQPAGSDWGARWGYSLSAEQMLFDGWRTQSAVAEALSDADAAAYQVRFTEQSVLLEAVIAFTGVVRAREVERLRSRSRAMLDNEVKAAQERMKRGVGTETDVAQTRARHAQAIADLIAAKAETKASIAEYERVTGRAPRNLERPQLPNTQLPKSVENAIAAANARNPAAITAELKEQASRYTVDRLAADKLPQVKLRGGIDGEHSISSEFEGRNSASVSVRVSVPVFDGGAAAARVEQAQHLNASLAEEARAVREAVHASVMAAWARLAAGRDRMAFEQESVKASRQALHGVLEEIRLGQRSTLDGLDAQRELVASEVRLAASERDLIVAAYALLAAMGQLTLTPAEAGQSASALPKEPGAEPHDRSNRQRKSWQPVVKRH